MRYLSDHPSEPGRATDGCAGSKVGRCSHLTWATHLIVHAGSRIICLHSTNHAWAQGCERGATFTKLTAILGKGGEVSVPAIVPQPRVCMQQAHAIILVAGVAGSPEEASVCAK